MEVSKTEPANTTGKQAHTMLDSKIQRISRALLFAVKCEMDDLLLFSLMLGCVAVAKSKESRDLSQRVQRELRRRDAAVVQTQRV